MLIRLSAQKKAQSIIEYVMLFAIVAAAITVTYKYVYRSMNARLKQVQEEMTYKRNNN
jgi:cell division protein FtsL